MPTTIRPFQLPPTDSDRLASVDLPAGSTIVSSGTIGGELIYVWAQHSTETETVENRTFAVIPDGVPIPEGEGVTYHRRISLFGDEIQVHLFEVLTPEVQS